jgi:hypothetical protein
MRTRPEKGQRRVAYRHHSFPSSRESGCRGMGQARMARIRPRHSLGRTPYRLTLCLFQWPTRLADGFGLKEITLPATGRIHPARWVPRSPNGDSAPEPLRYYVIATAGNRPPTPAFITWNKIAELQAPLDSLIPPLKYGGGSFKGVRPLLRREFLSATRRSKNAPTSDILPLL